MKHNFSFFVSLSFLSFFYNLTFSQPDSADYFYPDYHGTFDKIYKNNIQTTMIFREGFELSNPVIELNSEEKLKLCFDDLDTELKSYSFFIVHCNANWVPSDLLPSEYIKGVQEDYINDYKYSRNTTVRYIHYNTVFPNSNFTITKSGNYLLTVYLEEKQNIVLTKRFMVNENKAEIIPDIHFASNIEERRYKQEIDFSIQFNSYQVTNPYNNLKVSIMQNHRWDNAINNLKPTFVKDNELIYDYGDDNVFFGGNEFRHFDIKNFRFITERVDSVVFNREGNQVFLRPDESLAFKGYVSAQDINGKRLIKIDGNWDSEIDADYAYVHFKLQSKEALKNGNVYTFGSFSDWNLSGRFRLKFNADKNCFENILFLKQGYYNYQYVFLEDGKSMGDVSVFEGSHSQTENEYSFFVYHRSYGDNYDRLIATGNFSSKN